MPECTCVENHAHLFYTYSHFSTQSQSWITKHPGMACNLGDRGNTRHNFTIKKGPMSASNLTRYATVLEPCPNPPPADACTFVSISCTEQISLPSLSQYPMLHEQMVFNNLITTLPDKYRYANYVPAHVIGHEDPGVGVSCVHAQYTMMPLQLKTNPDHINMFMLIICLESSLYMQSGIAVCWLLTSCVQHSTLVEFEFCKLAPHNHVASNIVGVVAHLPAMVFPSASPAPLEKVGGAGWWGWRWCWLLLSIVEAVST